MLPVCICYSIYKGLSDPPLCSNCYRKWKVGTCWSYFLRASTEKMPVSITGFKLPTSITANSTSMHLKKSTKSVLLEMSSKNFKHSFWVFQQSKNKFLLHHYLLNIFLFFRFCLLIKTAGIAQTISLNPFKCFHMPCWIQRQSPTLETFDLDYY